MCESDRMRTHVRKYLEDKRYSARNDNDDLGYITYQLAIERLKLVSDGTLIGLDSLAIADEARVHIFAASVIVQGVFDYIHKKMEV